jgi:hypothetical protein
LFSIFAQYENITALSARVSKDNFKQVVNIKPVFIAPLSAYEIDTSKTPTISDIVNPLEQSLHHLSHNQNITITQPCQVNLDQPTTQPHQQQISSFTTLDDLRMLFDTTTIAPALLPQNSHQQAQFQSTQYQSGSTVNITSNPTGMSRPSQHVALVANMPKFQHYSNRIPVHTGK